LEAPAYLEWGRGSGSWGGGTGPERVVSAAVNAMVATAAAETFAEMLPGSLSAK